MRKCINKLYHWLFKNDFVRREFDEVLEVRAEIANRELEDKRRLSSSKKPSIPSKKQKDFSLNDGIVSVIVSNLEKVEEVEVPNIFGNKSLKRVLYRFPNGSEFIFMYTLEDNETDDSKIRDYLKEFGKPFIGSQPVRVISTQC